MARDPYEVVLADLRAKRDDIDKVIKSLEALRPSTPVVSVLAQAQGAPIAAQVGPITALTGMSIVDATRTALKQRGHPMGNAELATVLREGGLVMNSVEPANTISSVLHRAFQQGGDVVKAGRGLWKLAEWDQPPPPTDESDYSATLPELRRPLFGPDAKEDSSV